MPYIEQKIRHLLDPKINELVATIRTIDKEGIAPRQGTTNYSITCILLDALARHPSYAHLLDAVGTLEMAKQELYRRIAAPYEDRKRDENGEVY